MLAAALAAIAIPVAVGFVMLRGDSGAPIGTVAASDDGMAGTDMGGGATDGAAASQAVRDFAEIQVGEVRLEFDPAKGTAVLTVDTSIDAVCAVAYGPTADLGSLASDSDMAGGGHANHHPRLTGLAAGTVWYRLQGVGPDGVLYQNEIMQFEFPEGSGEGDGSAQPPLPNVASRATVTDVSSEFSDAYSGSNAIDGDLATEWSSAGDGDDAFIVLDFSEDMRIRGIGFHTREMTDGTSRTTTFTVTVDGTVFGPFDAGPGLAIALFEATGQVVRVDVETSTGGNTGAIEVEVYAEPEM